LTYRRFPPGYNRPWFNEAVLSVAPNLMGQGSREVIGAAPGLAPALIDGSMKSLKDDKYVERSYNVFNIGAANGVDAYAEEIAFPLRGDQWMRAVDAMLAKAQEFKDRGWVHTGPISLRFVKKSNGTLAPQQEDCCMAEIIFT